MPVNLDNMLLTACKNGQKGNVWVLGPVSTSPLDSTPTVMVSRTAVYSRSRTMSSAGF